MQGTPLDDADQGPLEGGHDHMGLPRLVHGARQLAGHDARPDRRRTRVGDVERGEGAPVDAAEVIRRDPDIIVASWCGKPVRKDTIAARPGWQHVAAVRHAEIHEIKSAYILQPGPASLTVGVQQLHDIMASWGARPHD